MSPAPAAPRVSADASSDDLEAEIHFDAAPWFEEATDQQIRELADCGWGGDYPADAVAQHFEEGATAGLFEHLRMCARSGDTVGFECHVDPQQALAWLRIHRPGLAAELADAAPPS